MLLGNLNLVTKQTAFGVASISVTNCFSDDYYAYLIRHRTTNNSVGSDINVIMRYIISSGVDSGSYYDSYHGDFDTSNTFMNYYNYVSDTEIEAFSMLGGTVDLTDGISYHYAPYDSTVETKGFRQVQGTRTTDFRGRIGAFTYKQVNQVSGIYFAMASGTATFDIEVYGVAS